MPLYDYVCKKCGQFEAYHGMRESLEKCPTCGGRKLERLISLSVNFIPPADMFWENENGGKGRFCGQLGAKKDANAYCRSRHELIEKAARRGQTFEKA